MARALSRREINLALGLALAAAVWMWHSSGTDETPAGTAAKQAASGRGLVIGRVPAVHMEQLEKAVVTYDAKGRDLFKYAPRPPTVREVQRMKAEAAAARKAQLEAEERARVLAEQRRIEEEKRQRELALNPPPPPKPQPPAINFRYIGFVGPPKDRVAAFDFNNETFVAKAGEVVRKDYRIDEIRYESVLISFVNPQFKGQTRELPLSRGK